VAVQVRSLDSDRTRQQADNIKSTFNAPAERRSRAVVARMLRG
jgi:hypothetical protein